MKSKLSFLIGIALLAAGCSTGGSDAATTATTTSETTAAETTTSQEETTTTVAETTAAPEAGQRVALVSSTLGDVIADGEGNTLYLFVPDAQGPSVCYDDCAGNWPPLVGEVAAGVGVDGSLLGSVARDDGTEQVTYNGWPLYYFVNDAAPGDTNGQGINDVWYVLGADGEGIGLHDVEAAGGPEVVLASSALGDVVADGDGNILYLFVPDAQGPSVCYDECAGNWPPLVGEVAAGDGVDGSLLGSVARDDGTEQVTYNGWPLYYFVNDAAPGDTNGQGINDVWYVVSASGDAIQG